MDKPKPVLEVKCADWTDDSPVVYQPRLSVLRPPFKSIFADAGRDSSSALAISVHLISPLMLDRALR